MNCELKLSISFDITSCKFAMDITTQIMENEQ